MRGRSEERGRRESVDVESNDAVVGVRKARLGVILSLQPFTFLQLVHPLPVSEH